MNTPGAQSANSDFEGQDILTLEHQAFQKLQEHIPMAVVAIDAGGLISYANKVSSGLIGMPAIELSGLLFFDLFEDTSPALVNKKNIQQLTGITDGEFKIVTASTKEKWASVSSKINRDCNGQVLTYLFIRDITAIKKKEKLFFYLNNLAAALAQARNTKSALDQIVKFIVPAFANWFTIDLIKGDQLELLILEHQDPDKIEWAHQYRKSFPTDLNSNSGSALVIKTGKPNFVPVVTDEMITASVKDPDQLEALRQIGLRSVMIVPLKNKDRIIGVISFISSDAGNYFDETDLEFAQNFAGLIGLSLENARLNEEILTELSLREKSEERFKFLIDAIPHKVWTSAPDGRATYYNRVWHDYTGIAGFNELRDQVWNIMHPEDRISAAIEWPKAVQSGQETEMEHRFKQQDGSFRWHLSRFTAHRDEAGNIALWVGTSTDIHEQKMAGMELAAANEEQLAANEELAAINEEQAATNEELIEAQKSLENTIVELATSEKRFKFLLNAMPQQVWTATPDGALNYVNDVVCADFGYTTSEIVGHGWQKFIHPDDLTTCLEKWLASLSSGKEYLVEFRLLFGDGTYKWHLGRAMPLIENDAIALWIGTNTNIELQKNNEFKKDEFLSIASHELRTPLTSIKAFNQILQRVKDPVNISPLLSKSASHILRLERLINDLLDVTKINSGKMEYAIEPFHFGNMLTDTVETANQLYNTHNITLENTVDMIYAGDRYRLEQVLNNFITNAIKYSPDATQVIIKSKKELDNIVVSVQDFGIGIAPENLDRLFDRYYRVDNTAMRFEGLGLGLFISSEILKRHQGSFWIDSDLGKGSTFSFRLPLPNTTQTDSVSKTDTYYHDSAIEIKYIAEKNRLDVDWKGYQNFESVQKGCLIMLDIMKKNSVRKIVNDNTHVLGSWSEAVEWTGNVWFPFMEEAGLKYFALTYSPSVFSQLSAKKSIDVGIGRITAQYFTDIELARTWIDDLQV